MPRTLAFFNGITSATGGELWETDGTAAATGLVVDILPGPVSSNPSYIAPAGTGAVVFSAADGGPNGQTELFASNGTAAGTVEINNSFVQVPSFTPLSGRNTYVNSLAAFTPFGNGRVLFAGTNGQNAIQLWTTDSTVAGTLLVKGFGGNLSTLGQTPSLGGFTLLGGRAVFNVTSYSQDSGFWSTDGTTGGTVQISTSTAYDTASLGNGQALFVTMGAATGNTVPYLLQVTDGTAGGTATLRQFTAVPNASGLIAGAVGSIAAVGNGRAVFAAADGTVAMDLWVSDGTVRLVQGPAAGTNDPTGFNPSLFTSLGDGRLVFAANDGNSESALWVTDGTAAGTASLDETAPSSSTTSRIYGITAFGTGKALVSTGDALLVTNGTASGTTVLQGFASAVGSVAVLPNGRAVFDVADPGTNGAGFQLWSTDGTAAGTAQFADVTQRPSGGLPGFTILPDGRALFRVGNADYTTTLWATSGTAAGTGPIGNVSASDPLTLATVADLDPLFDSDYYNAHNTDVAAAGVNAYQHFLASGGTEGRSPDPFFDSKLYLAQNPDVAAAGLNPLTHFEQYGWREGRDPSLLFSDSKYLAANPDVAAASIDPLLHYLTYGQKEGRATFLSGGTEAADPLVNPAFYDPQLGATLIPTGTAASQQAAWSYDTTGWLRGLNPDALFDTSYYLSHNPDVAAAHVNPLLQYEQYGWKEGRDPSAAFSTNKYLAANPDVAAAGVDPLLHYVTNGQAEGRAIYPA